MTAPAGQPMSFRFAAPCQNCRVIVGMPMPGGVWACSLGGLERIDPAPCRCALPEQSCPECSTAAARNEQYSKQAR